MAMRLDIPRLASSDRSRSPSPNRDGRTLYFAYGSNIWQHQMARRCPSAQLIGIARLRHWRWQINDRGYANIVEAPAAPFSPTTAKWLGPLMSTDDLRQDHDRVYGMVYKLEKGDEAKLDKYEDVPLSYTKEEIWVEYWGRREGEDGKVEKVDVKNRKSIRVKVMMYVDRKCTKDGEPQGPYRYKVNMGIKDALAEGVPQTYVDEVIRPFVPEVDERKAVTAAIEDAVRMGIDVKKILQKTEDQLAETGAKQEREMITSQDTLGKYLEKIVTDANGDGKAVDIVRGRAASSVW